MTAARVSAAIALALVATGCDPGVWVNGHVETAPDACSKAQGDVYASATPIAGAVVRLQCPNRTLAIAKTDATGHFKYEAIGMLDPGCTIVVEKEGYRPQTFALDDICVHLPGGGSHCAIIGIQAELTPAR